MIRNLETCVAYFPCQPPLNPTLFSRHLKLPRRAIELLISHYRVLERIGGGGMGLVYKAEDLRLHRLVALKFFDDTLSHRPSLKLVRQEAQAASALNHPNICTVYDIGEQNGQAFIAMEFLEGSTLQQRITDGTMPQDLALDLAIQIADGLAAAHRKGIIHRDIKPANIFVTRQCLAKLLDFGLAEVTVAQPPQTSAAAAPDASTAPVDPRVAAPGRLAGTIAYMSPEQVKGELLDTRTDLFSFGSALYEMATGTVPFQGSTVSSVLEAIVNRDPVPASQLAPSLPPGLCAIIQKALQKDRASRYQRASEMRADLQGLALELQAAVTSSPSAPASSEAAVTADGVSAHSSGTAMAVEAPSAPTHTTKKRSPMMVGAAVILIAAIVGGLLYYYYRSHHAPKLTDKDTVVIGDFANSTGDPVFDNTMKTALAVSLRQSPFLNVLSENKVAATLQMMARPGNTPLTPDVARELCQRAASKAYIVGSIASLGHQYVLELQAVNCQSGETLAQEQATAPAKEKVLGALGTAASKLRGELGESLLTVQKFDVPLDEATTSSLEALKAYTLGLKAHREKGPAAAVPYHQRAIQLDPNFALGYNELGNDYSSLGEIGRAGEYYTKAFALREHVGEQEKLTITAHYYQDVTGQLEKAAQTFQEMIATYPRQTSAYANLGLVYSQQGQYEKGANAYRENIRLAPNDATPYENLGNNLLALQRFDEARQTIQQAQVRKLDSYIFHSVLYALAFLGKNSQATAEQQQWFAGEPESGHFGLSLAADTEAYAGRLGKARELTNRSVDSAISADSKESGAIWQGNAAIREAAFGNAAVSKQTAAQALNLVPSSQGVEVKAALALAMAADTSRAESLAQDLNQRFPLDTQMQSLWLPAIRAQLALNRNNSADALHALQAAVPIELGQILFLANVSCLYPTYVRGEAYLAAGQGNAAAAEFQRIVDHPGIVWNCWTGALARLGVARANALQVRSSHGTDADAARVRALAAYREFLSLWKDADPGIPIYKQAQTEYAKLQSPPRPAPQEPRRP